MNRICLFVLLTAVYHILADAVRTPKAPATLSLCSTASRGMLAAFDLSAIPRFAKCRLTIGCDEVYHINMPRLAPRVPEPADTLCEGCGYVLNGLPDTGRCPECGKPIEQSLGNQRADSEWEAPHSADRGKIAGFAATTFQVIVFPTQFYRTLTARGSVESARRFAQVHWIISALLFGCVTAMHYWTMFTPGPWIQNRSDFFFFIGVIAFSTVVVYFSLDGITRLAARLTTWEGTYRGLRLPYQIVLRGIYFHAAHYLPVATAAFALLVGYNILLQEHVLGAASETWYLYSLSGLVIVSATYLFRTYWIGMRNMMYANR